MSQLAIEIVFQKLAIQKISNVTYLIRIEIMALIKRRNIGRPNMTCLKHDLIAKLDIVIQFRTRHDLHNFTI